MAEVLSIVTGVITIFETASKLSTGVAKLKRLWSDVQHVPDMIKQHLEQLEMLAPTLDDIGNEFEQTRGIVGNDKAAEASLRYCQRASEALRAVIDDMEKEIASARKGKRSMVKAKVVLRTKVIEDYERRLQNALQLVMVSQQAYSFALSRVRHSIMMSEFQTLRVSHPVEYEGSTSIEQKTQCGVSSITSCTEDDNRSRYAQSQDYGTLLDRLSWKPCGILPKFSYQEKEISREYPHNVTSKAYQARLQLPSWMSWRAWDFHAQRAYDGWKIRLNPWYTRPGTDR
ncbi:hypothetical protein B0J13DRAFT_675624, partial [Dactylonectria estremocensis]